MADLAGGGAGWLGRWWRRRQEAPQSGGVVLPVDRALALLEMQVCEGLAQRPPAPPTAQHAGRLDVLEAPRNAFGRHVLEETASGPQQAVALAAGMALSGLRASVFLEGRELSAAREGLGDCAERLLPLVAHAAGGSVGHGPYHALAESGLFQALASSGQEALDLCLVARWLAERALLPGLVASDGHAYQRLELPDAELVRSYLGPPDAPVQSPGEAQRLLFGNERPRLLRWFDPERPVGTGTLRSPGEAERASVARRLFFEDALPELARRGMDELARLTGRPLSFLRRHRLEDAELVLVGQGAVAESACAVADRLRAERGWRVGVLGITWLRPFPAAELAEALRGRGPVAVVEALAAAPHGASAPLLAEVEAAAGGRYVSAICAGSGPDPASLVGLCARLRQAAPARRVDLEQRAVPETTGFPRRDALLQAVAGAYPTLRQAGIGDADSGPPEPEGVRSAGLLGAEAALPADAPTRLAEALAAEAGPWLRGGESRPAPGVREARLRAGPADFRDPGPRAPVSLLLVAGAAGVPAEALDALADGGSVILAEHAEPDAAWAALPPGWQRSVRARGLRVIAAPPDFEAALAVLLARLRGDEADAENAGREVTWQEQQAVEPADAEPPALVRRIGRVRAAHDSLPRFWGELLQPLEAGALDRVPDPLRAGGAVPAGASALAAQAAGAQLPALDPAACSGCGRCWSACPEGAIGVSALGIEPLLGAASRQAGADGPVAGALRRAHKNLAGRIARQLVMGGLEEIREEHVREAWTWLAERMQISESEGPAYEAAVESTATAFCALEPVPSRPFFHEPEDEKQGAGELLVLAVDPQRCVGCGLCVRACPEQALAGVERSPERVAQLQERRRSWEALPDTSGASLERAARHPELGLMPAVLLSRHCAQAQAGGGATAEPGCGQRLAGRLVTALVEHHAQRRVSATLKHIEELRESLAEGLRGALAESLSATGPDTLAEALTGLSRQRLDLADLGSRLDALGAHATLDRRAALRRARAAADLDERRERLSQAADGFGRSRFAVVVAAGSVGDWAARFPEHPYFAPLTLAPAAEAVELARGIAHGLVADHLALQRALRRAALEAEAPPDRSARLEAIEALTWPDLEPDQRAACPPLLLLGDDGALVEQGLDALTRLLASDLPIKVILLDGRGQLAPGPEASLVAMAHRRAFVLAGSLAHPEHLARGVSDALAWPGPALVHLHAPSPRRHGFAVDATLEQARRAVEGRAHVLLRYDPAAEGVFGLRASVEHNPGLADDWGGADFASWALGEERFAEHFREATPDEGVPLAEWLALPESGRAERVPVLEAEGRRLALSAALGAAAAERLGVWGALRELAGVQSPFTERIRDALLQQIETEQQSRLDALTHEYEGQIAGIRSERDREALARLTDRLMALAGYRAPGPPGDKPS